MRWRYRWPLHARLVVAGWAWVLVSIACAAQALAAPPAKSENRHGVGLTLDLGLLRSESGASAGGLTGFAYRRYFGDTAVQINALPLYLDRGNELTIFAGLQVIHYALIWPGKGQGGLISSTSALRLTSAGSVHASRNATAIDVPDENCQTVACQQITSSKPALQVAGSLAAGLGVEFGAIQQSGFSVSGDLMMTVIWDRKGFYGAYPLPYLSAMYSW